jgi:hypothetical protein
MTAPAKSGGELFIVDNSDTDWKGLRYLQDWTEIASSFDIATGFFEIGSLLALDGKWQKLDRIRILMGDEATARTRQAILEGLRQHVCQKLDASLESEKESNDLLAGAAAIVQAMQQGKIQCRVYAKRKFHAKAYITHPSNRHRLSRAGGLQQFHGAGPYAKRRTQHPNPGAGRRLPTSVLV